MGGMKSKYNVPDFTSPTDEKDPTLLLPVIDLSTMSPSDRKDFLANQEAEAMPARQKNSVNHAVENLFAYAPVKIKMQKYLPESKNAGQAKRNAKSMVKESLETQRSCYPSSVAVDEAGNPNYRYFGKNALIRSLIAMMYNIDAGKMGTFFY